MATDKSTKTTQLKEIFVKWSLTTTFHCYPKIFLNKNAAVNIIWSIFFISFSFLTFHLLYRGINEFLEYDVVSKTRYFNEKSSPFPTVTICDTNQFSTLEAERLMHNSLKNKYKSEFFTKLNMSKLEKSLIQME